jgi:hypothetical protein
VTEKYAIYVVVVEDTSEADMRLSGGVVAMERIGGNLDYDNAESAMYEVEPINHDMAE